MWRALSPSLARRDTFRPPLASRASVAAGVGCRAEFFDLTRAWMASSSAESVLAGAAPPLDRLATFYKLVDKRTIAGQLCRYARSAELSAQAAVQAEALFGDDSLVVARLRCSESTSLTGLALAASGAEEKALLRRSFDPLLSLIPLLLRRVEANALLPGKIREEEHPSNSECSQRMDSWRRLASRDS